MRQILSLLIIVFALSTGFSCTTVAASNQLSGHPSPYLALHADDPVHWQSWQAEVFEQARSSNRLVLVSVGYFSCHWCHVMQRQSYQHAQTAEFLNRNFISVKVDRELEPDLDRRLITFVEQVRGVAGWPLNVFLTPDGYPLTGFTYLPQADFLRLLQQLEGEWKQNHLALSASAREFFELGLRQSDGQAENRKIPTQALVEAFVRQAMQSADPLQGGFGNTSKFPNVPQLDALLDSLARSDSPDPEVAEFVQLSLLAMASLNLRDHINGGFFRYTTDPDWQTPHFEKMLYDNAMLAALYLKAHRLWPEHKFASLAMQTLDFVEAQLKHPQGGYMSSLSAVDSANREGAAYLWNPEQLAVLLDATELDHLQQYWQQYPVSRAFLLRPSAAAAKTAHTPLNRSIQSKLQAADGRNMPADDKRLASWNAMMLEALTLAADSNARFGERARQLYQRMRELFVIDDTLIRFAGNADIADAVFEDYAHTAYAFMHYGRRFDDAGAIELARRLTERAHHDFLKQGRWQAKAEPLIPIARGKWVVEDLVFYSPMTLWMRVALGLPKLDPEIRASATGMLQRVTEEMIDRPYYHGSFISLRASNPGLSK
jgi:uncharacterized protein YyaL (SSP411 family)